MSIKDDYPKGCPPPRGYVAWHDWAAAQKLHGLKQTQCKECGLWLFPQDEHGKGCTSGKREKVK